MFKTMFETVKINITKKKKFYYFQKLMLLLLSFSVITGSIGIYVSASQIDKAQEEKKSLEQKKEDTEKKIKELEKEKGDILKYIEKLDMELNNLALEIERLETDIKTTETELEIARLELEAAKVVEAEQYDIMKRRIKYMYENGESSYLDLILQSDNISDILNHVEYISKITEYDNNLLDKYQKLKEEIIIKEAEIEENLNTLNNLKEEVDYEKSTVERYAEEKNKELVKYQETIDENVALSVEFNSKIIEQEEEIERLLEEQRRAEEERRRKEEEERRRKEEEERIRKEKEEEERRKQESSANNSTNNTSSGSSSNTTTTPRPTTTSFAWPVPSSSRVTSTFGVRERPTAGASTNHRGLDIGAPTGTPIVASASGRVITATYQAAAGNYLMIAHEDGSYTVYMHCSKLIAQVGDYVEQGELIALIGSTGASTGPHLHFGIMINNAYVDPQKYVRY